MKEKPTISLTVAAKLINMDRSNFWRVVTEQNKFTEDEAYKSGGNWLISIEGLKRVYGDRMKKEE